MKRCGHCKRELPEGEFHKDKGRKDGLSVWCKECRNAYWRAYHRSNPERFREYTRKYSKERYKKDPKYREYTRKYSSDSHKALAELKSRHLEEYRTIFKEIREADAR